MLALKEINAPINQFPGIFGSKENKDAEDSQNSTLL